MQSLEKWLERKGSLAQQKQFQQIAHDINEAALPYPGKLFRSIFNVLADSTIRSGLPAETYLFCFSVMSSCKISSSDLGAKSKKTKESSDTAASPLDFEIAWSFSKTNWDPLTISPSPAGYSPSFFIRMKK
ncbi:unnamed protein product [Notodromas monacha]|uniref:Uncharacterized protein n=1 Tax=Notodromas monacha TaxID=399045 RepID=A0A7R9BL66_9CRUS|nr:unnamed protein product [Notodromas monacha]CAG0917517.1 unnamed protein product [Notodromas monacha]